MGNGIEQERRRFRRVYFSPEHGVTGIFKTSGKKGKVFRADILNVSITGMALSSKELSKELSRGDILILQELKANLPLAFKGKVIFEVKWSQHLPQIEITGAGLEIIEAPLAFTDLLGKLIYGTEWDEADSDHLVR